MKYEPPAIRKLTSQELFALMLRDADARIAHHREAQAADRWTAFWAVAWGLMLSAFVVFAVLAAAKLPGVCGP